MPCAVAEDLRLTGPKLLGNGDAADVLHRPEVVSDEDLVVFGIRKGAAEKPGEVVKTLQGDGEHVLQLEMRGQRLPTVKAEWDQLATWRDVKVVDQVILTGHHRRQVCRHARRRGKCQTAAPSPARSGSGPADWTARSSAPAR
jgi:hypothetical protein